jgi:hypothetical protein
MTQTVTFDSKITLSGLSDTVLALQSRDYHSDFYYLTAGSTLIRNHPYLPGDGTSLSTSFNDGLTSRQLDYLSSTSGSVIVDPKHTCLVDKSKLLVYGISASSSRVFELHQL